MPMQNESLTLPTDRPLRLGSLVSGGGTTVKNLAEVIAAGQLDAQIVAVVCSNEKAKTQVAGKVAGLPTHLVSRKAHTRDSDADPVTMQITGISLGPDDFDEDVVDTRELAL